MLDRATALKNGLGRRRASGSTRSRSARASRTSGAHGSIVTAAAATSMSPYIRELLLNYSLNWLPEELVGAASRKFFLLSTSPPPFPRPERAQAGAEHCQADEIRAGPATGERNFVIRYSICMPHAFWYSSSSAIKI